MTAAAREQARKEAEAAMSGCSHPWQNTNLGAYQPPKWECPHCLITSPTAYDALCPDLVLDAIVRAVLAERERCAKVIEGWHYKRGGYTAMAHAIRNPPTEK